MVMQITGRLHWHNHFVYMYEKKWRVPAKDVSVFCRAFSS